MVFVVNQTCLVFKNNKFLLDFEEELLPTSKISGYLINRKDIEIIKSYKYGNWWCKIFHHLFH